MSDLGIARVLVIDDEEDMAQLIAQMLRRQNTEVIVAYDGQSGLDKALQENPDVIITDLMMPELDGFDLMEQVMEKSPDIPIVVITAYGSMKSAIKALRLGAFDFITKPFNRDEVENVIARAIRQQLARKYDLWRQTISNFLGSSRNPNTVAENFLSLSCDALGAKSGLVWWANDAPLLLNPEEKAAAQQYIAWTKATDLSNQLTQHEGVIFSVPEPEAEKKGVGSLIAVPIVGRNIVEGTLILVHERADYFTEDDLDLIESLTPYAALAIDNARTYVKLETSNRKLASLQRISALTYNADLPLNRILRLVVEGIRQNFAYSGVFLCLPEQISNTLVMRTAAGDLDRYLQRQGDSPTRRIALPINSTDNLISLAYASKKHQEGPIDSLVAALNEADASDMAEAVMQFEMPSYTALPLWQGADVIGILAIISPDADGLPVDERNLFSTIASQVSLIIKNASLYQAEQQGRREMEALYQAGLVITSSLSHAEVLKKIIQQIVNLTLFESCIIGRWDEIREAEVIELYLTKAEGLDEWLEKESPGTAYPLAKRPFVEDSLRNRRLRAVQRNDPDLHPAEKAWMIEANIHFRLIIPLIIRNKSIGVLELITASPDRKLTGNLTRITQGLAAQAATALENVRLHQSEIRRVEQEMELAQRIQVSLLPHEIPQTPGLSIAARSVSARHVGGDFYRYLSLPDEKLGVVIGDVSGKGVPSALFMAVAITALDTQIQQLASPDKMLQQLNAILYPRMQSSRMNTGLLIVSFDPAEKKLHMANAGMIAPLIWQDQLIDWADVSGLPLGAIPNSSYKGSVLSVNQDTIVILTSDGIIEAQNPEGEIFGFDRFRDSAQKASKSATSQEILETIWRDAADHIGTADPHDDMTLVVIRAWGLDEDAGNNEVAADKAQTQISEPPKSQ